jgi:hypothetical protein
VSIFQLYDGKTGCKKQLISTYLREGKISNFLMWKWNTIYASVDSMELCDDIDPYAYEKRWLPLCNMGFDSF